MGKHFVLFIEGIHNQAEDHLRRVGLPDLVAGASFEPLATGSPTGKPGMLFRWKHEAAEGLTLKWVPARAFHGLDAQRYWVGYYPDATPEPVDLMKKHSYPFVMAYVRNGVQWPLAQAMDAPADVVWNDDGSFGTEVEESCREFWQASLAWKLEWIASNDTLAAWFNQKPEIERLAMVYRCFRELYRIVPELLTALRLIGRGEWFVPIEIAIGNLLTEEVTRAIEAALSKKAEASAIGIGADISHGDADSANEAPVTPITNS